MWALLQGLRQQAADAIFAWPAKFSLPARLEFADPLLSRLAFFARYESLLRCLELRHTRCEPRPVQLLLGQAVELEAQSADRFAIVSGGTEIEPGGYPEWLLVSDGEAGRRAQLEYRDYASRAQLWQGRKQADLAVVGVTEVERDALGSPTAVTVKYHRPFDGPGPQPGQRLLLHPRFTDFTTDGIVEFLRTRRHGRARLAAPAAPRPGGRRRTGAAARRRQRLADQAAETFRLTASQAAAFCELCRRRAVPVWGPPGTGKTHFLAAAILALTEAYAQAGQPFRVLVTAFTHAAIENLFRKIAELRAAFQPDHPAAIGKAKDWQGADAGCDRGGLREPIWLRGCWGIRKRSSGRPSTPA